MRSEVPVILLEDDYSVRQSIMNSLQYMGYRVHSFDTPAQFFESDLVGKMPAVLVTDMCMPGMPGTEVQARIRELNPQLPVIFISGESTLPQTIQAMKQGAVDFLLKPFDLQQLADAIDGAIDRLSAYAEAAEERAVFLDGYSKLTPREQEVFRLLCQGYGNRELVSALSISMPTVKQYKNQIKTKLGITSLADIIKMSRHI